MTNLSELKPLNFSYYKKLLEVGISSDRAFQAAKSLAEKELILIREMLPN